MKKWIGFMAVLGVLIYAIADNDGVCRWALAKLELDEGAFPSEAFDKFKFQDQKAFLEKYQPLLGRRQQIVKVAAVFGNTDLNLPMTSRGVDMYKDCPLESDPAYQYLLFQKACCLDEKGRISEARQVLSEFMDKFPQSVLIDQVRQRRERLDIAAASH
jgi:hypothetical protein